MSNFRFNIQNTGRHITACQIPYHCRSHTLTFLPKTFGCSKYPKIILQSKIPLSNKESIDIVLKLIRPLELIVSMCLCIYVCLHACMYTSGILYNYLKNQSKGWLIFSRCTFYHVLPGHQNL